MRAHVSGKLLADGKLLSVNKHLIDTKHLALIQMLIGLTYLTIDEKLECLIILSFQFYYQVRSKILQYCWSLSGKNTCYYRLQRSWAKVIFLQACVCPRVGVVWSAGWWSGPGGSPNFRGSSNFGGVSPNFWGVSIFSGGLHIFGGGFSKFFFFFFFQFLFPPKILLGCTTPPPPPETVNAAPVHILLECILVVEIIFNTFSFSNT